MSERGLAPRPRQEAQTIDPLTGEHVDTADLHGRHGALDEIPCVSLSREKKAASLPDHLAVGLVNWTNREPALAVPGMFHHREPATVPRSVVRSTFKTFQSTAKRSNQRAAIWTSTASIHPFDTQHKTALSSRQDRPGPLALSRLEGDLRESGRRDRLAHNARQ